MYAKTKYHLFESAHSGLLPDQTVNLVPKTWTKRTVTDGEWMTEKTIKALDWRDYYLANAIDVVDEDKYEHYSAGYCIDIDKETNTISFVPGDVNYKFDADSGLFFDEQTQYVYTKIPASVNGVDNRIIMSGNKLDYYISAYGDLTHSADETTAQPIINDSAQGIVDPDSISAFPTGCNVVFVESAYLDINDTWSSWNVKNGYEDYYDSATKERYANTYDNVLISNSSNLVSSTDYNVFDPNDSVEYTGGFSGGSNFISGDVNMVPTGVLFIW